MFLVDHDQAQFGERQEQRRAGANHDAYPPLCNRPPGLAAFQAGQTGVPGRRRRAEPILEAFQPLRRERDLGQQDQHLPVGGEGCRDCLEIDLGLARARHTIEQGR